MTLNLGKLLNTVATATKKNPEIALAVVGLVAPKVVRKVAPVLVTLAAAKGE